MANTTNYNWETPDDSDLVKDGALAIRTLGSAIDTTTKNLNPETTLGDIAYRSSTANTNTRLAIGTSGQVLTVAGGVPSWATPLAGDIEGVTAGTGISGGGTSGTVTITNSMATEITAKGDLIIGTGNATFDNLPVGTNGHVLTADSTQTTGIKWAAASSTPTFVGWRVNRSASFTLTNNTTQFVSWDDETFDTDTFHDNSTNPSRITIPSGKGGYYSVTAKVLFQDINATGARQLGLVKNGSTFLGFFETNNTNTQEVMLTSIVNLSAADYIEVRLYQTSGNNMASMGGSVNYTYFVGQFLGA